MRNSLLGEYRIPARRGVALVHRGRVLAGNARKRKAKLTDATFHAMLGTPMQGAGQALVVTEESEVVERIEADGLVFEHAVRVEETIVGMSVLPQPAVLSAMPESRTFACQDYDFGYVECPTCHNDQAYYAHRADLATGFSFRCRVCRSGMTAWTKS